MPEQQAPRIAHQSAEHGIRLPGVQTFECTACRAYEVIESPARQHRVVGQDDEYAEYRQRAERAPAGTGAGFCCNGANAAGRTASSPPADGQFTDKKRQTNAKCAGQINNEERAATILTGDIRETPDIAQSNGEANSRQEKTKS